MALPEDKVHTLLEAVRAEFGDRQLRIRRVSSNGGFDEVSPYLLNGQQLSPERKLLLGGYFTHEVFARSRGLVQSVNGAAPGPDGAFRRAHCVSS